jgi:O-antigen/teichoic acid export membrane protein
MQKFRNWAYRRLRSSESFFKTDMVYLARGGFWLNSTVIFTSLFSFILSIAFANLLPKETYGIYQYILSVSGLLTAFTFSGMNTAITQAVARGYDGVLMASIRPQLKWNLIPALAAVIWALYYLVNDNITLFFGMMLVSVSLPIINTFNSYSAFLNGKKEFKKMALYYMSNMFIYYMLMFLCIIFVPYAIALVFVNLIINSIVIWVIYRRVIAKFAPVDTNDASIKPYAYHLSFMNVCGTIAANIDNFLVFHYLGAASLATYSLATILPEKIGGLFKFIPTASFPKFVEKSPEEIKASILRKLLPLSIFVILPIIAYVLVAPHVFRVLYPQYLDAVPYSQIYSLTLISIMSSIIITAFHAHKKVRELYILNTVLPIFQIMIQVIAIILWGFMGLVISKVISALLLNLSTLLLINSHQGPSKLGTA